MTYCQVSFLVILSVLSGICAVHLWAGAINPYLGAMFAAMLPWAGAMVGAAKGKQP
jgi:hypothetical protein